VAGGTGNAAPSNVSIPTSVSMTSSGTSNPSPQQDDPWAAAFETGRVSTTMTVTENPLNRPTDPAVRRQALDSVAGRPASATDTAPSSASTPSTAPGATSGTSPSAAAGSYTIQVGDTFSSIALDHYGESRHYLLIQQANPGIDPQRLKPGMTIKLPSLPTRSNEATRDDTAGTPAPLDEARQYRVQIGDSLHAISTRLYGDISRWQKIYELNRTQIGDNPARLKVGMILVLPEPPTVR
jgi:nucleoid-associated protein YgaU